VAPVADAPLVVVSNRGPLSFTAGADGRLEAKRGAGGLVSGLAPLVIGTDTTWIAAALSDGDREAAAGGVIEAEGFRVRTLALDPDDQRQAYDEVCNATLWFVHHGLYALAREPSFGPAWWDAWGAYERVNEAFARAVVEVAPQGATVLVQDYHLALLGPLLRRDRPDLRPVHFSHTPFAGPDALAVLPPGPRRALLEGMAAHHACGFHTGRWAAAFEASCEEAGVDSPRTFVSPLAPDPDDMASTAGSKPCLDALARLDDALGDRLLVARVDRIELSKNRLRGFTAFDLLLEQHPELRERVVFGAFGYPSREGLPAYAEYRTAVEVEVARVNQRWGTDTWQPILYDDSDDYPGSVAGLRRADVLLVNPIRDGLNLVAKEGPLVNDRNAVLLLSTEAGAWDELASAAWPVHPYDIVGTADALHRALTLGPTERAEHATAVRAIAAGRTAKDWLTDQVSAVDR
jgi:trehalose 6-phosphate synthase